MDSKPRAPADPCRLRVALEFVDRSRYAERRTGLADSRLLRDALDRLTDEGDGHLAGRLDRALGGPVRRLAVYGTLAPGERNHAELDRVPGRWSRGAVRGVLGAARGGDAAGCPVLTPDPTAPPVAAHLLESELLPAHWARLDAFEGPQYLRVLVPFESEDGAIVVANLYRGLEGPADGRSYRPAPRGAR